MGSVASNRHRGNGNAVHHGNGAWLAMETKVNIYGIIKLGISRF